MDSSQFGQSSDEKAEANLQPARSHGGSTTTSPVWEYFKLNENNPIQATCLMCGTLMSRGGISPSRCGTTNLRRHLSFAHGIVLPSKKKPQQAVIPISQLSESTVKRPLPLKQKQKKPLVPVPTEPDLSNETPYEICLRWKSYHVNMQTVFPSLLNNEHFVDVTLACEGRSIKCHRVILSACSSYFEDILCRTPCQHPIIIIKDLRFQELRSLIDFMYQGEVYVPQERLPLLIAAAEALQVKGLSGATSTANSQDEEVFPTTLKEEQKCFTPSDFLDVTGKEKSSSAVREKYQNLPRTSRPLGNVKSSKSRPNGIEHSNAKKLMSPSFGRYSHHKRKSAVDQIHFKYASQDSDESYDSLTTFHPQTRIKSELEDDSNGSLDHSLRQRSDLQDVILTNDSICPAPICELSDHESVNTNYDGEDKTWSRYQGMQSTDDNSETDDNDRPSQGYMMVPEVVMDCGENSEGRES